MELILRCLFRWSRLRLVSRATLTLVVSAAVLRRDGLAMVRSAVGRECRWTTTILNESKARMTGSCQPAWRPQSFDHVRTDAVLGRREHATQVTRLDVARRGAPSRVVE
jgi:hypothetical protein